MPSFGQRNCSTNDYIKAQLLQDPSLAANYASAENAVNAIIDRMRASRDTAPNEIITIPVVIHVLYRTNAENISDAQAKSQLDVLNRDYRRMNSDSSLTPAAFRSLSADPRIMFCLAQVDPTGRRTKGITRRYTNNAMFFADDKMKFTAQGGEDAWNPKKYLNIWVCNLGDRLLGYSSLPGGPADKDGVVINFDAFGTTGTLRPVFNKGRTATHEVGHWLGLKHTWGDANCGDDGIDDTPKQYSYNYNCPTFPHVSSCSPNGNGDLFMDFMDFTDDACMNTFTLGQKTRMRAQFALGGPRNSFLISFVCDSMLAAGGPLPDPVIPQADVIKIFPNPTADKITVKSNGIVTLSGRTLVVYNMTGVAVLKQILETSTTNISLEKLPAGNYIIRIDTDAPTIFKIVRL